MSVPTTSEYGSPHTVMTRSSLFGRSASLICLTATVSPVPIFKALNTEPNAPFPRQSPNCYWKLIFNVWHAR